MKKFYYFLAVISGSIYSSCSDTVLGDVSPPKVEANVSGIVYPLKMKSRSLSSFETNWENQTTVTLKSGVPVILPWAPNSDANLPVQMRDDIKKEDGWIFLLHTLGDNASTVNNNTNYMLFYNQRTSILKVFYYLENAVTNNYGFWMIDLGTLNHQLFNHSNDLSVPMDVNYINYWQCNNASSIFDLAFREGWNGFQVQLAYDTSNDIENVELDIKTRNANISIHDLYGDFSGKIQGSIVSHGSVNPFQGIISDIASIFGNTATDYIKEGFNDTIVSSRVILESLVSGIGGAIVKDGINKLFTNLTAGFSKPTTNISDITLTTKITGNLKGTSQFNGSAPIITYSAPFSTSDLGINLGVWNLASAPTIYIDPMADRTSDYFNGREYNYRFRGITGYNYDLRINPDLEPYLIKHWVDIDVVRYINKEDSLLLNPVANFDYGTLGHPNYGILFNGNRPLTYIYQGDANGKNKIVEEDMRAIVYAREGLYDKYGYSPTTISVPNEAMYLAGDLKYPMKDTYLRFNLFLVTEFEGKRDTTLHTRTFVPKVEWDPVLYNQYGNYSQHEVLPKIETMEENDNDSTLQIK